MIERRPQVGFTLLEVVVAFAIFALAIPALYESFAGAVRRDAQAQELEQGWLVAQSVLEQLRATQPPWKTEDVGTVEGGWWWHSEVEPYNLAEAAGAPWRAFAVTVNVRRQASTARNVTLKSIELVRSRP